MYAGTCFQGLVRQNNEDNFWCDGKFLPCVNTGTDDIFKGTNNSEEFPVFAIFDGMGGEECGEMASFIAVERFNHLQEQWESVPESAEQDFIYTLCQDISNRIYEYEAENQIGTMGTTGALLFFRDNRVYAANIGDSRIYRFYEHKFTQISEDHSCISPLYRRPLLTQFLGIPEEDTILSPCIREMDACPDEIFLLCSDGLTNMFTDQELLKILEKQDSLEMIVSYLKEETLKRGAWDNTTIILCKIRT